MIEVSTHPRFSAGGPRRLSHGRAESGLRARRGGKLEAARRARGAADVAAAAVVVAGTDLGAVANLRRPRRAQPRVQADLVGSAVVRRAGRTHGRRRPRLARELGRARRRHRDSGVGVRRSRRRRSGSAPAGPHSRGCTASSERPTGSTGCRSPRWGRSSRRSRARCSSRQAATDRRCGRRSGCSRWRSGSCRRSVCRTPRPPRRSAAPGWTAVRGSRPAFYRERPDGTRSVARGRASAWILYRLTCGPVPNDDQRRTDCGCPA